MIEILMKLLKFLVLLVFSMCLCACPNRTSNGGEAVNSTYDRVIEDGKIRVGYIHYPPGFSRDPNTGKFSGIMHDVLVESCRNLQIEVEFVEEVGWGTMIESLKSGRVDLVCTGLWPNAARGRLVDFSLPVYYSPVKAYAKAGDVRFDGNLSSANNSEVKISVIDGEMTSIIAEFDFPEAEVAGLPQTSDVSQVLLELSTGKVDITFVEPAIANEFLSKNPNSIREVADVGALRVFPNVFMVDKGESKLVTTINTAIDELANTGYIDKIVSRYEKREGELWRKSLPYESFIE